MTVRKHQMPLYLGTNAERVLETLVEEAVGSFWLETDTNDLYVWNGNSWISAVGTDTFVGLSDTPAVYAGYGEYLLSVNVAENAVAFVPQSASGALALDDLTDVNAPTPGDGDVLKYDSGSGDWMAEAGGAVSDLDDLADVDAPSPSDGDVLTFVSGSGNWEAVAGGSGFGNLLLSEAASVESSTTKNATEGGHSNVATFFRPRQFLAVTGAKFTPEANANYRFYIASWDGTHLVDTAYAAGTATVEMTFSITAMLLVPWGAYRLGIQRESSTGTYPYRNAAVSDQYAEHQGAWFESTYYSGNPLALKVVVTPYTATLA